MRALLTPTLFRVLFFSLTVVSTLSPAQAQRLRAHDVLVEGGLGAKGLKSTYTAASGTPQNDLAIAINGSLSIKYLLTERVGLGVIVEVDPYVNSPLESGSATGLNVGVVGRYYLLPYAKRRKWGTYLDLGVGYYTLSYSEEALKSATGTQFSLLLGFDQLLTDKVGVFGQVGGMVAPLSGTIDTGLGEISYNDNLWGPVLRLGVSLDFHTGY